MAFGPGPGPGPGPRPGPGGIPINIGPGAMPTQGPGILEGIAIENIKDKVCLAQSTNTVKYCINKCPKVEPQSEILNLNGAECIIKCINRFATSIQKCI